MSHSALSKSLKVLQEEIGFDLLMPEGRGIAVTDRGHLFYQKALSLLNLEKQILSDTKIEAEVFKLGTFEAFSTHLIGLYWEKYFGKQSMQLKELTSGQIEKAVSEKSIDVGITYEPIPTKDLDFIYLGKVTMGIYVRKNLLKITNFSELPFIAPLLPTTATPVNFHGLDGWPDHKISRNIKYQVDLLETGLALARSGLGAIYIPNFVAKAQNEALAENYKLINLPAPKSLQQNSRRVFLIIRQGMKKDKNVLKLIEMIKKECVID